MCALFENRAIREISSNVEDISCRLSLVTDLEGEGGRSFLPGPFQPLRLKTRSLGSLSISPLT